MLADKFLGLTSTGTFKILIQLGAISGHRHSLCRQAIRILLDLPSDRRTQKFVLAVLLAFLPAAIFGALFHKTIKGVLLESPMVVCISLVVGGLILLAVDRWKGNAQDATYDDVMDIPPLTALMIGAFQCLALDPRRLTLGRDNRWRHAARHHQA